MGPDTPMRDIVDSCRVWESHTEATDSWSGGPDPEYPRAIYQVAEDTQSPVALKESDALDQIMRQLLPTPAVSPPKATPIPSDRDLLIQRLLGGGGGSASSPASGTGAVSVDRTLKFFYRVCFRSDQ